MDSQSRSHPRAIIERADLSGLLSALADLGYRVVGPRVRDGAIIYDDIRDAGDLPEGWTDEQDGGHYRLHRRSDEALFGYVVGPHSWKQFLLPPEIPLWEMGRDGEGDTWEYRQEEPDATKYAFIGVRSCELRAIEIQDRVFLPGPYVDAGYKLRREQTFIVGVNCAEPGGACFCASMETGPRHTKGYDLALTEIIDGERHYFVTDVGSSQGAEVLAQVPHQAATDREAGLADRISADAAGRMGRQLDTAGLRDLLYANAEHPRFDDVAERCLTCGNCTMVCPTCFCTTVEDTADLAGLTATRVQRWDSCFSLDFSYVHGGHVRASSRSRYRQWLTHKFASWIDQFGTSGCVGCGRCIVWCPVGIDVTEELRALRADAHGPAA